MAPPLSMHEFDLERNRGAAEANRPLRSQIVTLKRARCRQLAHVGYVLINTPLQRGGRRGVRPPNRFSGFQHWCKTAEAVHVPFCGDVTPLKRGVNENRSPVPGGAAE